MNISNYQKWSHLRNFLLLTSFFISTDCSFCACLRNSWISLSLAIVSRRASFDARSSDGGGSSLYSISPSSSESVKFALGSRRIFSFIFLTSLRKLSDTDPEDVLWLLFGFEKLETELVEEVRTLFSRAAVYVEIISPLLANSIWEKMLVS